MGTRSWPVRWALRSKVFEDHGLNCRKKVFKYLHVFSYSYLYFDTRELPAYQTHLSGSVLSITTVVQPTPQPLMPTTSPPALLTGSSTFTPRRMPLMTPSTTSVRPWGRESSHWTCSSRWLTVCVHVCRHVWRGCMLWYKDSYIIRFIYVLWNETNGSFWLDSCDRFDVSRSRRFCIGPKSTDTLHQWTWFSWLRCTL